MFKEEEYVLIKEDVSPEDIEVGAPSIVVDVGAGCSPVVGGTEAIKEALDTVDTDDVVNEPVD